MMSSLGLRSVCCTYVAPGGVQKCFGGTLGTKTMPRYKNTRETVQILGADKEAMEALRSDPEWAECFTPMPGGGFKFGPDKAIHSPMHEGEGLPEMKPGWEEFPDSTMTFELQIRFKAPDAFEIYFAKKGSGRHSIFPYEGLPTKKPDRCNDAMLAAYEFCDEVDDWLADTVSFLFYARSMSYTDPKKQKKAFEEILSILTKKFKKILIWDRWQPVGWREPGEAKINPLTDKGEIPPGKIVIEAPVEAGRKRGIDSDELETKCSDAFVQLETEGFKITQAGVEEIVFPDSDPNPKSDSMGRKLRNALETNGLTWKKLLYEYKRYRK